MGTLAEKVCRDMQVVYAWCKKWRMKLSLGKTEVTIFHMHPITDTVHTLFKIVETVLKYNSTPRILGITLDEHLNFSSHLATVKKKASQALHVIREVKGIARMSSKNLVKLNITMVRPILEYGCTVWQTVSQTEMKKLEAIQRKALALCLSLPSTAALDALEVAAGIPPLNLRYCEIAIRDNAKISAKKPTYPLKSKLDQYKQNSKLWNEKYVSPIGLAVSQANETKRITGIDMQFVQPEPEYSEGAFRRGLERPSYWSQLGSSKNRSTDQQESGKGVIDQLMKDGPEESILCFTDGSCIPNPGPWGAGAVLYIPGEEDILIKRPVTVHGSILLAELVAILALLEHLIISSYRSKSLRLFSDSQTALGIITLNWDHKNYSDVIRRIKDYIQQLEGDGWTVSMFWTPGHSDILGNEAADRLAKEAAKEAQDLDQNTSVLTNQDIKKAARDSIMDKWQDKWNISNTGREYFQYRPQILPKPRYDFPDHRGFVLLLQLRTGNSQLNDYKQKLGQVESNRCECGEVENTEHFLLECQLYEDQRLQLLYTLQSQARTTNLDILELLSYEDKKDFKGWRDTVITSLCSYIEKTGRFDLTNPGEQKN